MLVMFYKICYFWVTVTVKFSRLGKIKRPLQKHQPTSIFVKYRKVILHLSIFLLVLSTVFLLRWLWNFGIEEGVEIDLSQKQVEEQVEKRIERETEEEVVKKDVEEEEKLPVDSESLIIPTTSEGSVLGVTETFTSSGTWTAPAGVTEVTVEVWGAGGGSPACSGNGVVTGGGGGGAYSRDTLSVTPEANYSYVVGTGSDGNTGGDTYWVSTSTVMAKGGQVGGASGGTGGAGGAAASGAGDVRYSGGSGASGGGGGAGSTGNGQNASGTTGGGATSEHGGAGGDGVNSGTGTGQNGSVYGGGGGGSRRQGAPQGPTSGANGFIRISYSLGPAIYGSLGKTTDSWNGAIPVYATLDQLTNTEYPYARAKVVTPASETYYVDMTWNGTNERFEGVIYPGSWYCNGCADPNTGTFTVTVEVDDDDFSSIEYDDAAGTFSTFITRRKSSWDTQVDYASFFASWNENGWWDHEIKKITIYRESGSGTDTVVAIPLHPVTSNISNISVTYGPTGGTAVSQGTPSSTGNAWWWDEDTYTLYAQFATLSTTLQAVNIDFRADTDLVATRFDRVQTKDMGNRLFHNGLIISNQYITTHILGGGHEGAGAQFESHAYRQDTGAVTSTDCMERTAVHVDDNTNCDSSGYYICNVKWEQETWMDWLVSEDNDTFVLVNESDSTPTTGYKQQLDTGLAVKRTQTYYSGKRYIKNVHELTNEGTATRKYPFVWTREQWLGTDRQTNDRGRFSNETEDGQVDRHIAYNTLDEYWHLAYDIGVFAAIGVIFPEEDITNLNGFLNRYVVIQPSGATWPFTFSNHGMVETENIGFDKTFNNVQPDETVSFTFWMWMYHTSSYANIQAAIEEDYEELTTTDVLSITITDGVVNYGMVPLNSSNSTLPTQLDDVQTVTSNNNTNVDLYIKGDDSTNWELATTPGVNFFVHEFCNATDNNCASPPTNYTPLTKSYQLLKSNISSYGSVDFHLRLTTPTETSYETEQETTVTVLVTTAE